MKRRKYAAILVHFYLTWMCVDFIDRTFGLRMCNESGPVLKQNTPLSLDIDLDHLQSYNGNCSCILQTVNSPNNVTLSTNITVDCGSMSLMVSHWNISFCPAVAQSPLTVLVGIQQEVEIFLDVSNNTVGAAIPGYMTFISSGLLSLKCSSALFDIPPTTLPPTTTTPTTTLRPTTTEPPTAEILSATIAITFFGFSILMLLIAIGIRHREKRRRRHDAETANIRQVIPDIERERIDPEMTRYSWFRTLTLRLKRIYFGEQRRGRSKHGQGARGRSMTKSSGDESPTGTQARRKFQRLFRKKSESTSSSSANRDHSPIEDDDDDDDDDISTSNAKEEEKKGKNEVFHEVALNHGGGVFMDARRPSCETLGETRNAETEDPSTVVTVHSGQGEPQEHSRRDDYIVTGATAEEEMVGTLFSNFDEKSDTELPKTMDVEINDDGHYADVEDHDASPDIDLGPSNGIHSVEVEDDNQYASLYPAPSVIDNGTVDGTIVVSNGFEPDPTGSVRSSLTENSISGISKISNGHPPDNSTDIYAKVDKSRKSEKPVALFRI